jgi:hypothetical protein
MSPETENDPPLNPTCSHISADEPEAGGAGAPRCNAQVIRQDPFDDRIAHPGFLRVGWSVPYLDWKAIRIDLTPLRNDGVIRPALTTANPGHGFAPQMSISSVPRGRSFPAVERLCIVERSRGIEIRGDPRQTGLRHVANESQLVAVVGNAARSTPQ